MWFADAVAALNRPHSIRETAAFGQHVAVAALVRGEPSGRQHFAVLVDDLDRR
jgi:hypothetical protein